MNPAKYLPLRGSIMIVNQKPKRRWQTAIKAREQQLIRLAEEALASRQERKVVNFLGYEDVDVAA